MTGTTLRNLLIMSISATALAACGGGADNVASPGVGAFPPTTPTAPTTPTTPTTPGTGTAAADCPTGFTNVGVILNGTLRNCQLPSKIVGNVVVPARAGTIYSISGRTDVGDDRGADPANPVAGYRKGWPFTSPGTKVADLAAKGG